MKEKRALIAELFLISSLTLFAELLFIRYLSSNIYLLSYYKNAVLISIFLGLGTGFMLSRLERNLIEFVPVATLVVVCAVIYFNDYLRIDLDYTTMDESIWPEFWANPKARGVPLLPVLLSFYLVMALYFIPFGHRTVRLMSRLRPLTGYSINIFGSLTGIVLFSILGWLWTGPLVWFFLLLVPFIVWSFRRSTMATLVINAASVLLTLFLLFSAHYLDIWSPYSKIRVYPFSASPASGFISTTNGNPQVGCINLDMKYTGPERALIEESKAIYTLPYSIKRPSSVLVVGAGAGNEVAVALREGVERVDAVEIDPVFIALGRAFNPHRPFDDSRVRVHVDDARAFFHRTRERYDLIVIGFLDSQYLLSQLSNLRTENFVYTIESLRRTRELLRPGGILQLNYNAQRPYIVKKLYRMLKEVFGDDLVIYVPERPVSGNVSFLAGPGIRGIDGVPAGLKRVDPRGTSLEAFTEPPTDDWPFLYLEKKRIPREYWSMLLSVPLLSAVFVGGIARSGFGFNLKYFLLGAGFMLLETKSITTYALLFGSTGTVISVVIASILAAILIANLLIYQFNLKGLVLPYVMIALTLTALYFVPLEPLLSLNWIYKLAISVTLIAAPMIFAAFVFGISFSGSRNLDVDLGSNIFGSVVGGIGEYLSMAFGFKALYLVSLLAYMGAFLIDLVKRE